MKTFETLIDDLIKEGLLNDLTNEQQALLMLELKAAIENKKEALRNYHKTHPINEFFCLPIIYEFDIHGTEKSLTVIDDSGFTKNDMYDD